MKGEVDISSEDGINGFNHIPSLSRRSRFFGKETKSSVWGVLLEVLCGMWEEGVIRHWTLGPEWGRLSCPPTVLQEALA